MLVHSIQDSVLVWLLLVFWGGDKTRWKHLVALYTFAFSGRLASSSASVREQEFGECRLHSGFMLVLFPPFFYGLGLVFTPDSPPSLLDNGKTESHILYDLDNALFHCGCGCLCSVRLLSWGNLLEKEESV